jgi:hypothetical protein
VQAKSFFLLGLVYGSFNLYLQKLAENGGNIPKELLD